mmetsp:Transcript_2762/g.4493  ORF Transcript_2762/g.4493 Transcript_2762/m.4493 type:complete len:255 (+) Transcript_2762:2321-3085(+)
MVLHEAEVRVLHLDELIELPSVGGQDSQLLLVLEVGKSSASLPDPPLANLLVEPVVQVDGGVLVVVAHGARPEEVLPARSVDLDSADDNELALAEVDGLVSGLDDVSEDDLVSCVSDLHQVGIVPVGQLGNDLGLEHRLLDVVSVELDAQLSGLDLAEEAEERTTGGGHALPARPEHVPVLSVEGDGNVRSNPDDISLFAINDWGMRHSSLETSLAAEHHPTQRRNVEAGTPLPVQTLDERTTDLISAVTDEID